MTARPWRAVAYWPLPGGGRLVARRTSRARRRTLTDWLIDAELEGLSTDYWQVQPIPEVATLTQEAPSGAR